MNTKQNLPESELRGKTAEGFGCRLCPRQCGTCLLYTSAHQITLYIKNRFPNLPLVLLGHSMGSMVVRCYTRKYDKDIDGLIVCGSPSRNAMAKLGLFLVSIMRIIKGCLLYTSFLLPHCRRAFRWQVFQQDNIKITVIYPGQLYWFIACSVFPDKISSIAGITFIRQSKTSF